MAECFTYLSTVTGSVYTEPNGTPHEISIHDLWLYNVTANTNTWVMTLPRSTYANGWSGDQGLSSTGIANTRTKFWTLNYDWSIVNKLFIKEYDIDQNDPTILTWNRDINLHPISTNPSGGIPYGIYPAFFTAIDNNTLIMCRDNGLGINPGDIVFELDITPGTTSNYGGVIIDAIIKDKFTFSTGHIASSGIHLNDTTKAGGDVIYLPSENAIYTNHEGLGHYMKKYDWCDGTLLTGCAGGLAGAFNGLSMYQGNLYFYRHGVGIQSTDNPERFLLNKQTCVFTHINDVNMPNPYSTGGAWQTTLTDVPAGVALGGSLTYTETWMTNATSSPCCDLELTNCGGCAINLMQDLIHPWTGAQTPINYIPYAPTIVIVYPGDCVADPTDGCCRCCTYDSSAIQPPNYNCLGSRWLAATLTSTISGIGNYLDTNEMRQWHIDNPAIPFGDVYFDRPDNLNWNTGTIIGFGECADYVNGVPTASVTGTYRTIYNISPFIWTPNGGFTYFGPTDTWNDLIAVCQAQGVPVTNAMDHQQFASVLTANGGTISGSRGYCGCDWLSYYYGATAGQTGAPAVNPNPPCQIINGQYVDGGATWKNCGVTVNGQACSPNTMNWGCSYVGGPGNHNGVSGPLGWPNYCDMDQYHSPSCPSCNKLGVGWVGTTVESFFEYWTTLSNGYHQANIEQHKYLLNQRKHQSAYGCYENGIGWWYYTDFFFVGGIPVSNMVTDWLLYVTGIASLNLLSYTVWNDFLTDIYGGGLGPLSATTATINGTNYFLGTYSELQQLTAYQVMEAMKTLPGCSNLGWSMFNDSCQCDIVKCIQNVPAPAGFLTKELCENSNTPPLTPPGLGVSLQDCCSLPWRCMEVAPPDDTGNTQIQGPYYGCVQAQATSFYQYTYATKEICEEADNSCNKTSYNCLQSISDCGSRDLLPHIVGLYWDDILLQPTNSISAVPICTNIELFSNEIFGLQYTDIREVRWEDSQISLVWPMCIAQSPLALANWPNPGWGVVAGKFFKEPFETGNINHTIPIPGLPVYTWSDYIDALNNYGFGQQLTLFMVAPQVSTIIANWMGWSSVSFGIAIRPCECDPSTVFCACVDPKDGSGQHDTLYNCENNTINCCGNHLLFSASTAGCMDPTAENYNPLATPPLGNYTSCVYCIYGCTNSSSPYYDPNATCACDLIGTGPGNNECCGTPGTCEVLGDRFRHLIRKWYYPQAGLSYGNAPPNGMTEVWTAGIENVLEVVIIGVSDANHVSNFDCCLPKPANIVSATYENTGPITHVVGGGPPTIYTHSTASPTPDGTYFPICKNGRPSPDMLTPGGVGISGPGTAQNPNYFVDFNGNPTAGINGYSMQGDICKQPMGSCYCSSAAPWGTPLGYYDSCCEAHPQIVSGIQCFISVEKIHVENTWMADMWYGAWIGNNPGAGVKLAIFSQNINLKYLWIIGNRGVGTYMDLSPNNNLIEVIITTGMYGCSESAPGPDVLNTFAHYWGWGPVLGSPAPPSYPGQIRIMDGCGLGLRGIDVEGLSSLKLLDIGHRQYHGKHKIETNHNFGGLSALEELKANSANIIGPIDLSGPKPNLKKINFNNNKVSGVVDLSGSGPGLEYVGFYKNNVTEIYLNSSVDLDVLRQLGQPGGYQNFRVGCNGPNGCAVGSTVILVHVGTQTRANYANGWSTLTHNVIPGSGFYGTQQANFVP